MRMRMKAHLKVRLNSRGGTIVTRVLNCSDTQYVKWSQLASFTSNSSVVRGARPIQQARRSLHCTLSSNMRRQCTT